MLPHFFASQLIYLPLSATGQIATGKPRILKKCKKDSKNVCRMRKKTYICNVLKKYAVKHLPTGCYNLKIFHF